MSLSKNVDEVSDLALTVTLGDSWVVSAHSNERWRDGPACSRSGHIPDLLRLLIAWKLQNLPLIKCFFDQSDKVLCSCLQMYTSEWSDSDPNEGGIWEEQGQDLGRDSRTINLRCTFMSGMVDLFDCSLYCTFTVCRLTPSTWNVRSIAGYGQI